MTAWTERLPRRRGSLRMLVPLAPLTWLRVGGPAAALFQPADDADLAECLADLDPDTAVLPMGVASNLLVRDGGIDAIVVRLGGPLARVAVVGEHVVAGGGALDQRVAQAAAAAGRAGLEFMIGIPGTVGGAVRMNAGAFGGETSESLAWAEVMDRAGRVHRLDRTQLGMSYRHTSFPEDWTVLRAAFHTRPGDPEAIRARMQRIRQQREAAQPLRVATGGSTFKNPPDARAWELIDAAGCRGLSHGAAMVSEKHCNFLVNTGGASAADIEELGEEVRRRVRAATGIMLDWEIHRIGAPAALERAA